MKLQNRARNLKIAVVLSIVIPMMLIAVTNNPIPKITGNAVYPGNPSYNYYKSQVLVKGMEVKAVIDNQEYYYIFDSQKWHETKDWMNWETREDMGETFVSGVMYLDEYGAKIYFKDKEVKDLTEFFMELK